MSTDRGEPTPTGPGTTPDAPAAEPGPGTAPEAGSGTAPEADAEQRPAPDRESAAASGPQPTAGTGAEPGVAPADEPAPVAGSSRVALVRIATVALCGVLGVALAAELRGDEDAPPPTAREADLVQILDELQAREERLRTEIRDLENRRRAISSSAEGSESALADARRRATELGILAGTVPAQGPGLVLQFDARDRPVPADVLLNAVEELRGAGAEAMQLAGRDGPAVRIVASTYFVDSGRGVEVDGARLQEPYVLTVIGDPATMLAALNIPGGVVDTVRQTGGSVHVDRADRVTVTALWELRPPRHARPVP